MTAACGLTTTTLHHSHSFLHDDNDNENNANDIQISMSNSSDASSDFFSPISCYGSAAKAAAAATKRRNGSSTTTTTPKGSRYRNSNSNPTTAEKLPPLHDSSWIGARLSPIGSFDREAAVEDDDDDDEHNEQDRLALLYHRALQESLDAAARQAASLRNKGNQNGRWRNAAAAAAAAVPHERTHLLAPHHYFNHHNASSDTATTTRKRGRSSQPLPQQPQHYFPLHPLWDRRRRRHGHPRTSNLPYHYRLDDTSYSFDPNDDEDEDADAYNNNDNDFYHGSATNQHRLALLRRDRNDINHKEQHYPYARYCCCQNDDGCCCCCCCCFGWCGRRCGGGDTSRYLPSFGTVLCTIAGLLLLAMLLYDAVYDFRHSYYYSLNNYYNSNNNNNNNNYRYNMEENGNTTMWSWALLQQWFQWEQQQGNHSTWITILTMRPRWSTFLLFGALIVDAPAPYQELNGSTSLVFFSSPWRHALHDLLVRLFYSSQFQQPWRFVTSSMLTTNVVEYLLVVLSWRLISLAATRVPWWFWGWRFAAAVAVGQWWTLLVGGGVQGARTSEQSLASTPVRLTGCLAWGTCGILCFVGTKCPSRRLVFFWLAILLVALSLVEQSSLLTTRPYGSVWGAVASSLSGWAAAAASNAQTVAQRERDQVQRQRPSPPEHHYQYYPDMVRTSPRTAMTLSEQETTSSSPLPLLAWLDFMCWLYRLVVAAMVVTPFGWALLTMLRNNT